MALDCSVMICSPLKFGRSPLQPVYESPLACIKNTKPEENQQLLKKNSKKKRKRKAKAAGLSKRQKTLSNETIVISDDEDNVHCNNINSNDVGDECDNSIDGGCSNSSNNNSHKPSQCNLENQSDGNKCTKPSRKLPRRSLRLSKSPKNNNTAAKSSNDSPSKDEEIAIVWQSKNPHEIVFENENTTNRNNGKDLFYIDTSGNRNLILKVSSPNRNKSDKNKNSKQNKQIDNKKSKPLREIVVDGLNVAYGLVHKKFCKDSLELVLNYFQKRGHKVIIFLPQHTRKHHRPFLEEWHKKQIVVFTPSRTIAGKNITPYDDRMILEYATKKKAIVVSSDQYRDLWDSDHQFRETIEKRLLPPTFVSNMVLFPEDPLGKSGPNLDEFLRYSD